MRTPSTTPQETVTFKLDPALKHALRLAVLAERSSIQRFFADCAREKVAAWEREGRPMPGLPPTLPPD